MAMAFTFCALSMHTYRPGPSTSVARTVPLQELWMDSGSATRLLLQCLFRLQAWPCPHEDSYDFLVRLVQAPRSLYSAVHNYSHTAFTTVNVQLIIWSMSIVKPSHHNACAPGCAAVFSCPGPCAGPFNDSKAPGRAGQRGPLEELDKEVSRWRASSQV
eukprot:1143378-Pelagomonas_calceolata.AAC.2